MASDHPERPSFHLNSGMDGSSVSSPLESPDAPIITSSVATLQSAESLSLQRPRQVRPGHETLDTTSAMPSLVPDLNPLARPDRTPETPSANISSRSSTSGVSQAFTSHFTSETSLLPTGQGAPPDDGPPSPSAILTPSTEVCSEEDADGHCAAAADLLGFFGDEPWDASQFDYDLSCLDVDGLSQRSDS